MPPKKNAKGGAKKDEDKAPKEKDPDKVTEVNKVQYEIQLAALDQKIGRLNTDIKKAETTKDQTEQKIEDLRANKKKVITFLTNQLKHKTAELQDLEEKLEGSKQEFDLEVSDLNECVKYKESFPVVIPSEFRMGQYRHDDLREDTPHFMSNHLN